MTSLSHYYDQTLLAQGAGQGIGMGLISLFTLSIVLHHFRRCRSLVYGVMVSGTAFGGVIGPLVFNYLFQSHARFAWGARYGYWHT